MKWIIHLQPIEYYKTLMVDTSFQQSLPSGTFKKWINKNHAQKII